MHHLKTFLERSVDKNPHALMDAFDDLSDRFNVNVRYMNERVETIDDKTPKIPTTIFVEMSGKRSDIYKLKLEVGIKNEILGLTSNSKKIKRIRDNKFFSKIEHFSSYSLIAIGISQESEGKVYFKFE